MKWIDAKMKVSIHVSGVLHDLPKDGSVYQFKQQYQGLSFSVPNQELGVTDNPNYKITFMLDSAAMITVHTPKRGVVEVSTHTVDHKHEYKTVLRVQLHVVPRETALQQKVILSF